MDNERRADLGREAAAAAAKQTNVMAAEPPLTAITDVLAYVAPMCERCRLSPYAVFDAALRSYRGDFEDGPRRPGPSTRQSRWPRNAARAASSATTSNRIDDGPMT